MGADDRRIGRCFGEVSVITQTGRAPGTFLVSVVVGEGESYGGTAAVDHESDERCGDLSRRDFSTQPRVDRAAGYPGSRVKNHFPILKGLRRPARDSTQPRCG